MDGEMQLSRLPGLFWPAGERRGWCGRDGAASHVGRHARGRDPIANFMFATGIENSIPTINHGKTRVDEMEVCGHYDRWREDFDCVQEIGINFLRYGPPFHTTYLGPNKFNWNFADMTFAELKRRDI